MWRDPSPFPLAFPAADHVSSFPANSPSRNHRSWLLPIDISGGLPFPDGENLSFSLFISFFHGSLWSRGRFGFFPHPFRVFLTAFAGTGKRFPPSMSCFALQLFFFSPSSHGATTGILAAAVWQRPRRSPPPPPLSIIESRFSLLKKKPVEAEGVFLFFHGPHSFFGCGRESPAPGSFWSVWWGANVDLPRDLGWLFLGPWVGRDFFSQGLLQRGLFFPVYHGSARGSPSLIFRGQRLILLCPFFFFCLRP